MLKEAIILLESRGFVLISSIVCLCPSFITRLAFGYRARFPLLIRWFAREDEFPTFLLLLAFELFILQRCSTPQTIP